MLGRQYLGGRHGYVVSIWYDEFVGTSLISLICNPELVENIRESRSILKMYTNAGSKLSNQQATVPEFGTVWFEEDASAKIFGFGDLVDQYWITYDSAKDDAFLVHMKEKTVYSDS